MSRSLEVLIEDTERFIPYDMGPQVFIPKPFVFEGMISASTKVYLPGQMYLPFCDGFVFPEHPACYCVHLCDQFLTYPVLGPGIRCIPTNTKCPFGGRCHGAHIMIDGKPINKSMDMNSAYISRAELKTR